MGLPQKPLAMHFAALLIIFGMIMEMIGIAVNSLRADHSSLGLVLSHIVMASTAFGTTKYVIDLERGRLSSKFGLLLSIIVNIAVIVIAIYLGYSNAFLVAAFLLDGIGTMLLFHPRTLWWFDHVRKSADT